MAAAVPRVELGFVEDCVSWRLKSEFFPSKVGGKPAWLSPNDLPNPSELKCKDCEDPCSFLLQVYAPRDEHTDTFHRTLFVFVCKNAFCSGQRRNGNVFRCQLPRINPHYSSDPTPEDEETFKEINRRKQETQGVELCVVCGCAGPKKCSKCRAVSYCCKKHQVMHWKIQGHKEQCGSPIDNDPAELLPSPCLLREFELVTEPEAPYTGDDNAVERTEEERIKEYEEYLKSFEGLDKLQPADQADLEAMATSNDDKVFRRFKKRIESEPTQVLRFQPGGIPLWVSSQQVPTPQQIPPCQLCGSPRTFEFQVMPQILNHLGLDRLESSSLDFGTLAVFTCSKSCSQGPVYKEEFIWVQHIT